MNPFQSKTTGLAMLALGIGVLQSSAAVLIYDDFNRDGALHGSTVTTGGLTWTSSANNNTTTANGGQVVGGWNAKLAFTPEEDKRYQLTLTVGPTIDQALRLGFANHTGGLSQYSYLAEDISNMMWGQIGIWYAPGYDIQQHSYYGATVGGATTATAFTLDAGMGNGYVNTIDLFMDTTAGLSSAQFTLKVNGVQKGTWTGNVTNYNSIVFGRGTSDPFNTQINDLTLSVIPEPSSLAMFGMTAGILLRRRRKAELLRLQRLT